MDGRGGTGQIVNFVHLHIERECDVVPDPLEVLVSEQVLDIATGAREEVVDADDDRLISEQSFTQMRAKKADTTGHEVALL
jgi:hypothetical protein